MSSVSRIIRRKSTLSRMNRSDYGYIYQIYQNRVKCRKFYTSDPSTNTRMHQILGWRRTMGVMIVVSSAGTFYFEQKPWN